MKPLHPAEKPAYFSKHTIGEKVDGGRVEVADGGTELNRQTFHIMCHIYAEAKYSVRQQIQMQMQIKKFFFNQSFKLSQNFSQIQHEKTANGEVMCKKSYKFISIKLVFINGSFRRRPHGKKAKVR